VPCSGGLDLPCDLYVPETFSFPYFVECKNEAKFCINSILNEHGAIHVYFELAANKMTESRHFWKSYETMPDPVVVFKGGCFSSVMIMYYPRHNQNNALYHANGRTISTLEKWLELCPKHALQRVDGTHYNGSALSMETEDDGEVN
jgi:hypothetical protein